MMSYALRDFKKNTVGVSNLSLMNTWLAEL